MSTATGTRPRRSTATSGPRPSRPSRRVRVALVVLGMLVLGGLLVWVVGWSSLLGVADVRVVGAQRIEPDRIIEAAAVEPGTPLARVDADAVKERVRSLPRVSDVEVRRGWPRELVIVVTEREPVAVLPQATGWALVDATGTPYLPVAERPADLPEILASGDGLPAAVAMVSALPAPLHRKVREVTALTPDSVRLTLRSGAEVTWGSAEDSARKAEVLLAMLPLQARAYDVSAPDLPTSTGAARPHGRPVPRPAPEAGSAEAAVEADAAGTRPAPSSAAGSTDR